MPRQAKQKSQHDIVSFENPPVAEVVLSAQFPPDTVDLDALGHFSREVREELPQRQRQPVLPAMFETFDIAPASPSIEIRLEPTAALPRTWFMSQDGGQIVQLQHDRLTLNWRDLGQGSEYPRYSYLRERFRDFLGRLAAALDELGQHYPINLCEVMYVNPIAYPGHVSASDKGTGHPDLARIVNRVRRASPESFLGDPEDSQYHARWRIPGDRVGQEGMRGGRLYASAAPGFKPPKNEPIYVLNLMARVLPKEGSPDSAMRAMDIGHNWVVSGFKDLTTSEMHRYWGLKETT